jgi:hypothetical protein
MSFRYRAKWTAASFGSEEQHHGIFHRLVVTSTLKA